nr:hypothetical protein [Klebsiella pneumoniae]
VICREAADFVFQQLALFGAAASFHKWPDATPVTIYPVICREAADFVFQQLALFGAAASFHKWPDATPVT